MRATGIISLLLAVLLLGACQKEKEESEAIDPNSLRFAWWINDVETRQEFEAGAKWYFSYLGASITPQQWEAGFQWKSANIFEVHFDELGFSPKAMVALREIISRYRHGSEYKIHGAADFGSWVANTLNNSYHYYEIVGFPPTLYEYEEDLRLEQKRALIDPSTVSFGQRLISFGEGLAIHNMKVVAEEVSGNVQSGNYAVIEKEVIDVMANGQLRYAVYLSGRLAVGADPYHSAAGKPAKCMWCHESNFIPNFGNSQDFSGFMTRDEFNNRVADLKDDLFEHRKSIQSIVDLNDEKEHTMLEKLYIRFDEPSAKRLAQEWLMTEAEVKSRLSSLTTHKHGEFPEMGNLYYRHEVMEYAPHPTVPVPVEMREATGFQPDLIQ